MSECAEWRGWMLKRLIVARVFMYVLHQPSSISYIGGMAEFDEQRLCIKFCVRLGKTGSETFEMLKQAFGDSCISRSRTFEWFGRFNNGRNSTANYDGSGRPSTATTPKRGTGKGGCQLGSSTYYTRSLC